MNLEMGFAPTLFTIPLRDRKKKVDLSVYFPFVKEFEPKATPIYELTEHDINRAKVFKEQNLDIYLAIMVEYVHEEIATSSNPVRLRLFRTFPKLSGIVAPGIDDLQKLAEYLDVRIVDLDDLPQTGKDGTRV